MLGQFARLPGFAASADPQDTGDAGQLPVVIGQEPEPPPALSELGAAIPLVIAGSLSGPGHPCPAPLASLPGPLSSIPGELAETGARASSVVLTRADA